MDKIIIEKHNKKLSNKVYPIISQRSELLNQTMPEQKKEENIQSSREVEKQKSNIEDVSFLEQESKVQKVHDFHPKPKIIKSNKKEDLMEVQSRSCINRNHDTLVQNININEINQKKIENSNVPQNFSTQGGSKIVSSNQNSGKQSQTDRNSIQLQDKFQQILQKRNDIQAEFLKQVSTKFQQTQFQFDQSILTQRNQNNKSKTILDKSLLDKSILEKSQQEDKPLIDKSEKLPINEKKNEKKNERTKSNNKLRNSKFKGNYALRMNESVNKQLQSDEKSINKQQEQEYMSNKDGFGKLFQSHCNQEIQINNAKCYIDQIKMEKNQLNQNFNSQQISKTPKVSQEQKKKDYQRMVYNEINNALTNNLSELTIQLMNKYQQNINSKFNQNWGIIHFSCKFANQQLLDYVKEQKGDINLLNSKQQTGLFVCIKYNNLEFLKQMLLLDITINYQDYNGNTILHYAVKQNQIEIIKFLLTNKKINLNIENICGKKPIDLTQNSQIKQIFEISQRPKLVSRKLNLDDFKIIGLIGKGSYGEVFLVELIENKQKFAMKTLEKKKVLEQNLVEYIYAEKNILQTLNHPFIVKLRYSFQNHSYLFMILDLCNKGDLEQLIKKQKILNEDQARFYMAEVLLGMEYIHSQNIIYRDLKPENVVIDQSGHAKITDFGLAKENITHNTKSFCGTYAYLAPEMINKKGHTKTIDWYIFGTVLYEFLTGLIPFYNNNRDKMFQNVLTQKLNIPNNISAEAQSIIAQKNPDKRLGKKGAQEIKNHPFFKSIDWEKLYNKEIEPPVLNQQIEIKQNSGSNLTQQIKYQSYKIKQWSFYQQ